MSWSGTRKHGQNCKEDSYQGLTSINLSAKKYQRVILVRGLRWESSEQSKSKDSGLKCRNATIMIWYWKGMKNHRMVTDLVIIY